jgi:hypothetical protein
MVGLLLLRGHTVSYPHETGARTTRQSKIDGILEAAAEVLDDLEG